MVGASGGRETHTATRGPSRLLQWIRLRACRREAGLNPAGSVGGERLGPLGHTIASIGIGAGVWGATGTPLAVPAAAATGVLIDADHVLDYFNYFARNDRRHVYLLFHGWEFSLVALAAVIGIWYHPVLLAAVLGHLGHLVGDQLHNKPIHPMAYSFIYRASVGFSRERLFGDSPTTFSQTMHKSIPLWRFVEPTLLQLWSRFFSRHG